VAPARRQQTGERRQQSTISWPQPWASLLPAEHRELMPQHEQLNVLSELAAPAADQQPQHSRESEIGERFGLGRQPIGCEVSTIWYSRRA
jgi:hypothetical protein